MEAYLSTSVLVLSRNLGCQQELANQVWQSRKKKMTTQHLHATHKSSSCTVNFMPSCLKKLERNMINEHISVSILRWALHQHALPASPFTAAATCAFFKWCRCWCRVCSCALPRLLGLVAHFSWRHIRRYRSAHPHFWIVLRAALHS